MTKTENNKNWNRKNPEKYKQMKRRHYCRHKLDYKVRLRKWRRKNPVTLLLTLARYRARKFGVPFNITKADIEIPKFCPILGIRLSRGIKHPSPKSPTLDRIIPCKGYVRGNVAVISYRANSIKRDATLQELEKLVQYIKRMSK